jgi:flagella basal body P-ring formation protein FlgA
VRRRSYQSLVPMEMGCFWAVAFFALTLMPNTALAATLAEVESALELEIFESLPWSGATFELAAVDVVGKIPPMPWKIELSDRRFRGRVRASLVSAGSHGREARRSRAWVTASIDVMIPVAVSSRRIGAGDSVVDYRVEMRSLRELPHDFLQDLEALDRVVSKVRIRDGEILRRSWMQYPLVIKRRQHVRVIVVVGGATVHTQGEAMAAARVYDRVRVKLASGVVLDGKATEEGRVEVLR